MTMRPVRTATLFLSVLATALIAGGALAGGQPAVSVHDFSTVGSAYALGPAAGDVLADALAATGALTVRRVAGAAAGDPLRVEGTITSVDVIPGIPGARLDPFPYWFHSMPGRPPLIEGPVTHRIRIVGRVRVVRASSGDVVLDRPVGGDAIVLEGHVQPLASDPAARTVWQEGWLEVLRGALADPASGVAAAVVAGVGAGSTRSPAATD